MIIDYSFWRPDKRTDLGGVHGAIRYISHDARKAITEPEMTQLHKWGIATALVFEDQAARAEAGKAAGTADGEFARARAAELGVPPPALIWCAVDFDVPDYAPAETSPLHKLGPIADYLGAFRSAVHPYTAGAYGGYWLVSRALDAGIIDAAWQTSAWSGGQVETRIALYQPGVKLARGDWDIDLAGWRDWGQFRRETRWVFGPDA